MENVLFNSQRSCSFLFQGKNISLVFIQLFSEINCNLNSADSAVSLIQLIQPLSGSS